MKFRDFSFRAFDTEKKSYVDFEITSYGNTGMLDIYAYPHIEIELWSGRVDSCGKRIYEGDIVESITPSGKASYFWISDVRLGEELRIEMIDKGTSKHYKSNIDEMKGEFDEDKFEYTNSLKVIGNIHENPELFKELK